MRLDRPLRRLAAPAAVLAAAILFAPAAAVSQPPKGAEKAITAKGQVKVGVHRVKMDPGKMYNVKVEANGFTPSVTIRPGSFLRTGGNAGGNFSGGNVQGDTFEGHILPTEARDYRITVAPDVNDDEVDGQLFDYSVTVTPIPMAKEPLLDVKAKTTAADPKYQHPGGGNRGPHKAYTVNFKAGQIYIISLDMTNQGEFDPYLIVEGPGGKIAAENDDGGNGLNSLIVYQPKRGGEHRLIATGLGDRPGGFRLKVVTTAAGAGGAGEKRGPVIPDDASKD
ncbi:hypothetical protein J0H58_12895 [bacterium]|nr:hypothetical protein [bacterium]